jgi:tripartite-type tricarboxylate transporter receptor subunit TctC
LPDAIAWTAQGPGGMLGKTKVIGTAGGKNAMAWMLRALIVSILTTGAASAAFAQTWPDRPIRFITSQAAGNATDIIARVTAEHLTGRIGQAVVVENRPGGGNVIGTQAAARSAPDGYTFFFATAAALVTDPYTFKSLPYDPMKDFVPVVQVAEVSFMVMANPKVPAKNLTEFIALAKAQPGKFTIATDGLRRFSGMIVSWISKLAGIQILQVPYTAQRQGVQDAIGGNVDLIILAVPAARGHIASGKLRPLAITSLKRAPEFPDVPAVSGLYPDFDFTGWMLLAAPTGTPPDILRRMNREVNAMLKDAAVQKQLRDMGFSIQGGTLDEARDYVNRQHAAWGKVVKEIGIQPD